MTVLDWVERVADIDPDGIERLRTAAPSECAAVAAALAIPAVKSIAARYRITPLKSGRFGIAGDIEAEITQTCGIELEDFDQLIREPLEVEFWPEATPARRLAENAGPQEIAVDPLSGDEPEPVRNGRIEIGRVIYEIIATALDPFPIGPGAELDAAESGPAEESGEDGHPFAALAALRRRGGSARDAGDD